MDSKQIVKEGHFKDLREQIFELQKINESIVFDYESTKGEKEARSHIFKMRQSKSAVVARHHDEKADALKVCKELDEAKRDLISAIDSMIEVHDKPLREIKERRDREAQEKAAREQFEKDWDAAIIDNDLFNKKRELDLRQAELDRQEAARKAKEEAERKERERIAREEQLKKEAAEQATREAEESARRREEEALRKQIEAEQAAKRAQEEKEDSERRAKLEAEEAERKRVADIKAAEEKAEREKQAALAAQRREQEEKERRERERLEKIRIEEERRMQDREHRANINRSILHCLVTTHMIDAAKAKSIIEAIAKGEVPNVSIKY